MSRRWMLYILCAAGVIVFFRVAIASNKPPASNPVTTNSLAQKPFPAEASTSQPQTPSLAPQKSAGKAGSKATTQPQAPALAPQKAAGKSAKQTDAKNETSNLTPALRTRLVRIVKLYASWPGTVPQKVLIRQLEMEEPFITSSAITQIEDEWAQAVTTVELTVKAVNLAPGFVASSSGRNSADIVAYVLLKKRFKPVTGKPYTQMATQPYQVNLRIIKRRWTVVGFSPLSASTSSGG